ncbi:uncharacterized protein MELLADRAFT_109542 [Melampsora larici-populina 98AG31]|uniref:Uncharacterized protein n=1 Tax=Melampsora larici-populina (strain 98AG31 / pathotype 3-4-7) TaxID=747676 RepID=F4RWT6_MELLP|nr:uncharacterized protein MELLADRAFT_109542 [Melampsora larici-populina 98AG31]EGG03169.1 hypothetical protein MELLADRAFT_109542 [Melampsora larici-populina 98AG31]
MIRRTDVSGFDSAPSSSYLTHLLACMGFISIHCCEYVQNLRAFFRLSAATLRDRNGLRKTVQHDIIPTDAVADADGPRHNDLIDHNTPPPIPPVSNTLPLHVLTLCQAYLVSGPPRYHPPAVLNPDGRDVLVGEASSSEKLADGIAEPNCVEVRKVDGSHESDGIAAPETGKKSSLPASQAPLSVERNAEKDTIPEGKGSRVKAVQDYMSKVWKSFKKRILQAWRYLSARVRSLKLRKNKVGDTKKAEASSKNKVDEPAKTEIVKDQFTPSTSENIEHVNLAQGTTKEPLTTPSLGGHHVEVEVNNGEGSAGLSADSQTNEVRQGSKKETNSPSPNAAPFSGHKGDVTPLEKGERGVTEDAAHSNAPGAEFKMEPEFTVGPQFPHSH